nr:hypothetical protein BCU57_11785 [Shewanella sp. 10N.286.48.B5]
MKEDNVKKIFILCVLFAIYQNWPLFPKKYDQTNEVVLYATDWCGYCEKARVFFDKNNIAYTEFDIEKSAEGRRRYENLGGDSIPLLDINGSIIRGYNERKMAQQLYEKR